MRIVHVSMLYDEKIREMDQLAAAHYTITGWAEALQRNGAEVTVISRFGQAGEMFRNNVRYIFHRDKLGGVISARQLPWSFLKKISRLEADVVHFHHLSFSLHLFLLRRLLPRNTALVVQHHGGVSPPRWKRAIHNFLNRAADGFFFTTPEQGREWLMKKKSHRIYPVMEGATFFSFADRDQSRSFEYANREAARKRLGTTGNPVFLWVGRLDTNKDPLTVLDAMETFFREKGSARLQMIYHGGNLETAVREKIRSSTLLEPRVQLLPAVPHEQMQEYYEGAEYFVLGSHYEGSGYALSEALHCGCIPVVTDIPSFRMMTNNGELGALWEPGNAKSLAESLFRVMKMDIQRSGTACIGFFRRQLSFDAIAGKAMHHYQAILEKRK